MRCSNEIGVAGRLGNGLVAVGARAPIGLDLPAGLGGFSLLAVDPRGGLFAGFFFFLFLVRSGLFCPAFSPRPFFFLALAFFFFFFFFFFFVLFSSPSPLP